MTESDPDLAAEKAKVTNDPASDAVLESESTALAPSEARTMRFYDRLRDNVLEYVRKKGTTAGKGAELLFFVPDVFILLWRLANDKAVDAKNKVLLGTGLAYYIFPLDIMPEALLGPIGYLDDLIFAVFILNKVLGETSEALLRKHWSGDGDVLDMIKKVLNSADTLVAGDMLKKLKKIAK